MRRKFKNFIYLIIVLIPCWMIFNQSRYAFPSKFRFVEWSQGPIRLLSAPFVEIKKIIYYHRTFDEYWKLRSQVNGLKARLAGLEAVINENSRLEKLLDFKRKLVYASVAANVVGIDPAFWNSSMIVDKGLNDGIRVGQPVVSDMGVVGKVFEVGPTTSKIVLITDPTFSVAATVQRPGEIGLVSGTLQGLCRMRYLNADADLKIGDEVVTSKISTAFPENLLIGEIVEIKKDDNDATADCLIKPTVTLSQLQEVLIITK